MERTPEDIQAHEVMKSPVETVRIDDLIQDTAALFTENAIGAAIVTDRKGEPVGVISKTDIVRYELAQKNRSQEYRKVIPPRRAAGLGRGFQPADADATVDRWMTPAVFSVTRDECVRDVAKKMLKFGTHHMFVRADSGSAIIGVISSFDILRNVASGWTDLDGRKAGAERPSC